MKFNEHDVVQMKISDLPHRIILMIIIMILIITAVDVVGCWSGLAPNLYKSTQYLWKLHVSFKCFVLVCWLLYFL